MRSPLSSNKRHFTTQQLSSVCRQLQCKNVHGNQSARDARATQRGEARRQEDELQVLESDMISADSGVQGQEIPKSPTVGQCKVTVHEVADEEEEIMPELAYSQAVSRLIEVDNAEVKKKAKKIAAARRTMDGAVDEMWAAIKSADRSTCPQVDQRTIEIRERMADVMDSAKELRQAIKAAAETVAEHMSDDVQADLEATLMTMLQQSAKHAKNSRQEGYKCQERLEKFNKASKADQAPAIPARGASGSTGGWNMWKGDATLKPSVLSKDAVPCDFRNFQRDFATYIKSGETPTIKATANTIVGHMRVCIDSELNTAMRDLWIEEGPDTLKDNLANLETVFMKHFPISKRRQMLLEAEQEAGELTSEYWRRMRRMTYEAEVDKMTSHQWHTMLSLAKTKDEDIKEKLMVMEDLTFNKAMAMIDTIKKARITQGKDATTIRKLDMQVNRVVPGNKTPATISCFRCSRPGHYKSQCEMAPQQCPICKRDHVEAAHKDFPPRKTTGERVRKTPAKSELKPRKKKPAPKRVNLSGESSESERDSRGCHKRSKSKTKLEQLRRLIQSSDSSESEEETSAESSRMVRVEVLSDSSESDEETSPELSRMVKVEVRGANLVENPTLLVDVWRRLTSKNSASIIALADTGASKSVIGLALVKKYKLKLDTGKTRVSLTNASGHKMSVEGTVTIFLQPEGAPTRKMIKAIVSESVGNDFLLGLPDLKHLQLLPEDFPRYRGEKYTVSNSRQNPTESMEALHHNGRREQRRCRHNPLEQWCKPKDLLGQNKRR